MRLTLAFIFFFISHFSSANQWHSVDKNTWLISPEKQAHYIQTNQAILIGEQCALIVNAHGDFVALEHFINVAKQKLNVPVCYLISTSADPEQILGMALIQRAFPSAKWYAGQSIVENFARFQNALQGKIAKHQQSIKLSTQRASQFENSPQLLKALDIATQRLKDWQGLELRQPIALSKVQPLTLQLGNRAVILSATNAFSSADIFVFDPKEGALLGGNSVDLLPEAKHSALTTWLAKLKHIKADPTINWILPSHGKPYKREAIALPIAFISALKASIPLDQVEQYLSAHYMTLSETEQLRLQHYYALALRRLDTLKKEAPHAQL